MNARRRSEQHRRAAACCISLRRDRRCSQERQARTYYKTRKGFVSFSRAVTHAIPMTVILGSLPKITHCPNALTQALADPSAYQARHLPGKCLVVSVWWELLSQLQCSCKIVMKSYRRLDIGCHTINRRQSTLNDAALSGTMGDTLGSLPKVSVTAWKTAKLLPAKPLLRNNEVRASCIVVSQRDCANCRIFVRRVIVRVRAT